MRTLHPDRYKWIALRNATLAVLLTTLDGSITIIAMPDTFRGIHLDPLVPANAIVACLIAAAASLMRGGHPAHEDGPTSIPRRVMAADPEDQRRPRATGPGGQAGSAGVGCSTRQP